MDRLADRYVELYDEAVIRARRMPSRRAATRPAVTRQPGRPWLRSDPAEVPMP